MMRDMAEAIAAVHAAGFIHRDICPRNFIINPQGTHATLIDFGLTVPDKAEFRQPGNRTGTPLYMAPEIVRRRPTDKRVDLFAAPESPHYRLLSRRASLVGRWRPGGMAALQHDASTHRVVEGSTRRRPRITPRWSCSASKMAEKSGPNQPMSSFGRSRELRRPTSRLAC
ncbi:MAG: protein kinase [Pirellulaceae bacterium]